MQPKITIISMDALSAAKMRKDELAAKVEELAEEDLCDCCMAALQASANGVEEFFNKCHGEGGKFCGGPSSSGRGPGTRTPAPIDYIKSTVGSQAKTAGARAKGSKELKSVTTSVARSYLIGQSGYATPKLNKLAKADLSKFSTEDLTTIHGRLQADQRMWNAGHTAGWATLNPIMIGYANWRTKRNPVQQTRIEGELKKRKVKLESSAVIQDYVIQTFAGEPTGTLTLAQEIAGAKKMIAEGNTIKVPGLSDADKKAVIASLQVDDDAGLTAAMVADMKKSIENSTLST